MKTMAATKTKPRLTLKNLAIGAGYDSLVELAKAAQVPPSVVYQANVGNPPSTESGEKILEALNAYQHANGMRPRFTYDDLLDAVDLGGRQRSDRRRPKKKGVRS